MFFLITFVIFLLESPDYYNIPKNQVGSISGAIGTYAEICIIGLDLVLGIIFDTVGRKLPTAIGFAILSICIIIMPFCKTIYPAFLLLKIFASLGLLPG